MRLLTTLTITSYTVACLTACGDDDAGDGPPLDADASIMDETSAGDMDAAVDVADGSAGAVDAATSADAGLVMVDASQSHDAALDGSAPSTTDGSVDGSTVDASDGATDAATDAAVTALTALSLDDVSLNPQNYEWFDFRPNVKKLILSGAVETEHIAILWYTVEDGAVGLHYHSMTESVYVIDGTQTDAKGVYPTGSAYFNPPGSGHEITNSSGFFVLAYASAPDFENTDLIGEYTPVRVDTQAVDLLQAHPFEAQLDGVETYVIPLDPLGGMTAQLIHSTSTEAYAFLGNYVLVLEGSCQINGETYDENLLVVATSITPHAFTVTSGMDASCLAMSVSF